MTPDGEATIAIRRHKLSAGLPVILLLAACAPDGNFSPSRPTSGPVLSDVCQQAYRAYLDEWDPVYFAADRSGQVCAAVICQHEYCVTGFPGTAIRACERISDGAACFVYAEGVTQSWRGPEPVAGAAADADAGPGSALLVRLRRQPFSRFRHD